jgi:hypothetical protein
MAQQLAVQLLQASAAATTASLSTRRLAISPSLRLVNQRLSGTRTGASAQRQKRRVFLTTIDQRRPDRSIRKNPDETSRI